MDMIRISTITNNIRNRKYSAKQLIEHYLQHIKNLDSSIHSITRTLNQRALEQAKHIDHLISSGKDPGPLAGVPFGVKDLFDLKGEITTAGSMVMSHAKPALQDATIISRLCHAGAIPIATLNMDEFAYGFITENKHYGTTRNPHDTERFAGGSSGGSAASVAAGILPFSIGSDTNGSIRVPAALCGIWGIRPTYNLVPLDGVFPFSQSFDTVGPFARTINDLQVIFEAIINKPLNTSINLSSLRIARLGGWFEQDIDLDILSTISKIMALFHQKNKIEFPHVDILRAASYLITAAEGGALHLPWLRHHAEQYDPATRDRLIAGATLPSSTYFKAKEIEHQFQSYIHHLFDQYDILIAPTTGSHAPRIDHPFVKVNDQDVSARVNLGIYTQPITLSQCPVLSIPIQGKDGLPKGIQLVAKQNHEHHLFALGSELHKRRIAKATILNNNQQYIL